MSFLRSAPDPEHSEGEGERRRICSLPGRFFAEFTLSLRRTQNDKELFLLFFSLLGFFLCLPHGYNFLCHKGWHLFIVAKLVGVAPPALGH